LDGEGRTGGGERENEGTGGEVKGVVGHIGEGEGMKEERGEVFGLEVKCQGIWEGERCLLKKKEKLERNL